jgi:hypothetical protein
LPDVRETDVSALLFKISEPHFFGDFEEIIDGLIIRQSLYRVAVVGENSTRLNCDYGYDLPNVKSECVRKCLETTREAVLEEWPGAQFMVNVRGAWLTPHAHAIETMAMEAGR